MPQYLQFSIIIFSFTLFLCCLFPFWPGLFQSLLAKSKSFVSLTFPILVSVSFVLPPSQPKLKLVHCLPHWYLLPQSIPLIILVVMASLFMPLMNCSLRFLLFSLYLESVVFTCNMLIHSCLDSSPFLLSLHYCNNNIILLCYGLNVSLNILTVLPVLQLFCMPLIQNL